MNTHPHSIDSPGADLDRWAPRARRGLGALRQSVGAAGRLLGVVGDVADPGEAQRVREQLIGAVGPPVIIGDTAKAPVAGAGPVSVTAAAELMAAGVVDLPDPAAAHSA